MHIRPRTFRFTMVSIWSSMWRTAGGAMPLLLASPLTFTSTSTSMGVVRREAAACISSARRSESMLCTRRATSMALRTLLRCSEPIMCQRTCGTVAFGSISLRRLSHSPMVAARCVSCCTRFSARST